jgi:hypothetical protein
MLQARVVTRMMCQWQIHEEEKKNETIENKDFGGSSSPNLFEN